MVEQAPKRILLIEDDEALRQLIGLRLGRRGYEVVEVASLRAAAMALEHGHYDLVITDIHLPDGDAISIVHESRSNSPELPVVFITGDADRGLARQALAEDPAGFLIKPFEFTELEAVILHALRGTDGSVINETIVARGRDADNPIPLLLRPKHTDHRRLPPPRLIAKLVITALVVLIIAFVIGNSLVSEQEPEIPAPAQPVSPSP